MLSKLTNFIDSKRSFVDMFGKIAENVTAAYVNEVHEEVLSTGVTPSFEQLMDKVRALHDDLTRRSVWVREDYREDRGYRSTRFTKSCKKIIDRSTQDFLRSVKLVLSRRNSFPPPSQQSVQF